VTRSISLTGFYGAVILSLILGGLKLTVETHWSWWRVLLPVWVILGQSIVYVGVGLIWLSFAADGITQGDAEIREGDHTNLYQLAALLCFAMFADNVLRRIEGGQKAAFGLSSGRWEVILAFGVISVALHLLFWSEVIPPARRRSRGV
jgi:hypothetical protein